MTIESTVQQPQQEADVAVTDQAPTKIYYPGTRGLKEKKKKSKDTQSTTSLATTMTTAGNTDHFQNYDPVVSTGRKSWKHSLKKATSSVLYMAMPPSNSEQLPMVVPETPMSPDKLPSTPIVLRTPIKGPPSLAPSTSTGSSRSRKSTGSMDQPHAESPISQMPPMPTLNLSALHRAHTSSGSVPLRDPVHVHGKVIHKDKERKSTSEQPTTPLLADISSSRRTKSFSAATPASYSGSASGSSSQAFKASNTTPPVPAVVSIQSHNLPGPSGESRKSSSRSNRNSMDSKSTVAPSTTAAASHHHQQHHHHHHHHQPTQPLQPSQLQQPQPSQDSSDDDLELASLPLPPSYTQGRGDDPVSIVPAAILSSMFGNIPPSETPLPTLPLPPTSSGVTRSSSINSSSGATGATLSRSSTTSTIHTTSTMQTTIVTATRVTAMAATEVPVAPTPKPKRPTLGGPRHSSPVLVKPIVLSESEDEQAFENLLRTVIIPLNRPTNLTDASLIPHQLSDTTTLSNQDNGEHDVDDKDGAYAENDYPIAESLVGDIEDVGVAEDESDTPHTESLEVLDEVQISGSLPSVHEELPSEVEEESGDIQGEGLTTIEDQVLDLRVQEPILGEADPEHHQVDLKKRPIETSEQEVGDEEARGDTSSESIVPQDLDQEEAETPEETKDEKEEAEEAEEEMVISPLPVQTLPREPKHKEIVIFGEDLIVEIAAHLWSGSEDEMEPRSPELSATTMVTTAIQLPQSSAVTAATNEPQTQPRSLDTIECISEPAEIMETSVVAPNSANCAVDPKLTGLPQGTLDTVPTMSDLPPLEVGITSLLLLPPLVETDTNVTSLEHQDTSLVPDSPTILATDSQCLVTIQTASPLPSPPSPPPAQPAHARRVTSRRQQRQQYRQEQRQLRAAAAVLRNQRLEARKARVSPWVWKQEGIRHHRLESHQILTKEQVLERFHMELNEDGPNGFFLFKLVRRFQDPAEANSKKTTSTATTAGASSKSSGASGKEASSSKNKGESSVSPSSFAQRLKRQLWLQKSKKEKKSSSNNSGKRNSTASDMGEEDIRSMLMMNNNASMSDLGSSLQEVIDAVDSLKHDSHLWVDEDATVLMEKNGSSEETTPKVVYPQSDDEFAIRDKDHLVEHVLGIERRKGIYSTGRLDGMDLMPKKRFRALQRRSSSKRSSSFISTAASKASSSSSGLETIGDSSTISASATTGSSSLSTSAQPQFKKKAVMQLHIYSRNGLKFKFDVMDNDELHFVEASKKYTFMDPLPAHRQPTLPSTLTRVKEQEQEDETSSSLLSSLAAEHTQNDENSLTRSLNTQRGIHPMYMTNRQLRSSMYVNNHSNASSSTFAPGLGLSNKNKRLSIASTLTSHSTATSSVPSGKRVFVTRLGRHTLLTYHEYKDLAKTPGFLTLGAKLLIQRNISSLKGSSTPSSHPSAAAALSSPPLSASAADDAPLSPLSSSITGSTMTPAAATTVDASIATPLSTSSSASGTTSGEPSDYFAVKKKPIALPGFGKSKSNRSSLTAALNMAASASSGGGSGTPSTPLTPSTPTTAVTGDKPTRAIVTPYNPNDYKTPTPTPASETNSDAQLVGSSNHAKHPVSPTATAFSTAASTVSTTTALSGTPPIQIPSSPPPPPTQPMSPSSPTSPMSPMSSDATIATTVVGAGAVPVNINKKGHQAGLKFHHLFAVVHQRLCKLELEDKTPFMNVGLVQWAPITDPAELRWWRDTVGISMIGWVEGDDPLDESHCGMDVEEDLDDGWEEDSEDEDEDLSESDDDDDDEFFDMQSHFADDDDDKDDDSEKPEGGPLGRPQIAVDEDQRDEDEDIYDRSIGRSPPTSSPIQLRLRPLSTATTATTATFQTACSRLHRVASPTPGSDESMSRGERGGSLRRIRSRSQQQQALPHRRPSVVASSPSSDAAQPPQKRLSKSPRTSTSTTTSHPPRQRPAHIMVERLGYRFVRVSGYTGVLKVTVSEKVEARAVALAIEAQAHVQQWHPSVSDCHQADCELVVLQEKGAEECAKMKRPWEEGAEGIGLEPGEAMIERMSMIVAQARAFKGNYYMKTVKMFNKVRAK